MFLRGSISLYDIFNKHMQVRRPLHPDGRTVQIRNHRRAGRHAYAPEAVEVYRYICTLFFLTIRAPAGSTMDTICNFDRKFTVQVTETVSHVTGYLYVAPFCFLLASSAFIIF